MRVQHVGLRPLSFERTTYDTTGAAVSFRVPGQTNPTRSAHLTFFVYTGTALVSLSGDIDGPFIEFPTAGGFDFPIEAEALYIKAKADTTDVAVVAAVNPIMRGPR